MSQDSKPSPDPTAGLANIWGQEAQSITYDNMQKLSKQDEFTIGQKTYKRKMLKPKDMVELGKLQKESEQAIRDDNDEKTMEVLKKQAKIVLVDFTDQEFEDIDVVALQSAVGACLLISRGFRRI